MQHFNSYVNAQIVGGNIFWVGKKIISLIRRGKNKDPIDTEAKKMIEKIVKKETSKLVTKIEELQKEVKLGRTPKTRRKPRAKPKRKKASIGRK
jgi:hypothetical protein